jgi:5-methylthioadenosine/S-adenosylhomocysteine deaminase
MSSGPDLLLAHGTVVTVDSQRRVLEDGAVAIQGQRIVAVGPTDDLARAHPAARVIDCRGKAVIPGLIDAHGHGGHALLKTLGSDTPAVWMRVATPTYFHYTTPEFWRADGLLSALERLRFGVTCGVSVLGSQPRADDPAFAVEHARSYGEVGVREILCTGPCHPPWPHPVSYWRDGRRVDREVTFDEVMAGAEAAIEACHGAHDGRVRAFVTPFTILTSVDPSNPTPPELATTLTEHDRLQARRVRALAEKYSTRIHSDAFGGMVRLASRDEAALLGPDVHLQHCRGIGVDEVEILASTGTHVTHAPGPGDVRGYCPVPELMVAGANVAITTDGTSPKTSFDLFQAMRKAQMLHQIRLRDMHVLPAGKLLEMVTVDAARALGCADELGSLEVGKRADVTIVDLRQPHLVPNWMVVHRLAYEAVGQDVTTVIVDGRVLMEERKVLTVDEPAALDFAEAEARAVVARAGLEPHLTAPGWGQVRMTFDRPVRLPEP